MYRRNRSLSRDRYSESESDIQTLNDAGDEHLIFGGEGNSLASKSMEDMLTTTTNGENDIVTMIDSQYSLYQTHPPPDGATTTTTVTEPPAGWAAARPPPADSASQFPMLLPKSNTGKTADEEEEDGENDPMQEPFVYPKHLQGRSTRSVAPPSTILCGRNNKAASAQYASHPSNNNNNNKRSDDDDPNSEFLNDMSMSMWQQRLCGIRADRLIVLLILILFLAIAVIVGALLYSNRQFLSSKNSAAASPFESTTNNNNNASGAASLDPSPTPSPTPITITSAPSTPFLRPTTFAPTTIAPSTSAPSTSAPTATICDDSIQDDLQATFPIAVLPPDEYVSCEWIAFLLTEEQDEDDDTVYADQLCQVDSPEYYFCKASCGNCDTATVTEWPRDACGTDATDRTFFVGQFFGEQDCAWLQEFYLTHGDDLCTRDASVFQLCRETCRNCGPRVEIMDEEADDDDDDDDAVVEPGTEPTNSTDTTNSTTAAPTTTVEEPKNTTLAPTPAATLEPTVSSSSTLEPTIAVTASPVETFPPLTDEPTSAPTPIQATTLPTTAATMAPTTPQLGPPITDVQGSELFFAVSELIVGASPSTAARLEDPLSDQTAAAEWLTDALAEGFYTTHSSLHLLQLFSLMTFAFATEVENWVTNTGWGDFTSTPSECDWFGVVCTEDGFISELDLVSNNLVGRIPPEIQLLQNSIRILVLSDNTLQGRIPEAVTDLYNLEELFLDRNMFNGELPSTIGNMLNLRRLYIERNPGITGVFPESVAALPQLEELVFYYTRITDLTNDICGIPEVLIFDCRQVLTNDCWTRCFYLCGGATGIPCAPAGQAPPG